MNTLQESYNKGYIMTRAGYSKKSIKETLTHDFGLKAATDTLRILTDRKVTR